MQGGLIGGICLLACLLSMGQADELGDTKQSDESDVSERKETESSIAEEARGSINDVKNSKEASDDLKSDANGTKPFSPEEGLKSNTEKQNDTQSERGASSSVESPDNRSVPDSLAQPGITLALSKSETTPKPVLQPSPSNSGPVSYFMDTHFAVEQGTVEGQLEPSGVSSGLPEINSPYFSGIPFIAQGVPTGAQPAIPSPINPDRSQESVVQMNYFKNPPVPTLNQEAASMKPQPETIPPKYIERSFVVNKSPSLHKSYISNIGKAPPKPPQESHFSPLFSSGFAEDQKPPAEYTEPSAKSGSPGGTYNLKFNKYSPIPQLYSYDSKATFDQTRRESPKEEIQVRNADESQYTESMNSYPYTPLSSKSDFSSNESEESRSGAPDAPSYSPYQSVSSAQAYAGAQVQSYNDDLTAHNQGLNPYSYGYPPGPVLENLATASASAQLSSNGAVSAQSSAGGIEDAKSRVIMPHEYIFPHKMPGGEDVLQCSRENELHHFWSPAFDCLVCICLNEYGVLEPVCASCSGCQTPAPPEPPPPISEQSPQTPEPYMPLPIPDPNVPEPVPKFKPFTPSASAPSLILEPAPEQEIDFTTPLPVREVPLTCSPLPSGHPFPHPLQPCQQCICKDSVNAFGKIDVRIECQDSPHCVVPPDVTTLPPIPDPPVPVPLPGCEKFPPHVSFPHPTEKCKQCTCSVELSDVGVPEQQITCLPDSDCDVLSSTTPKTESTSVGPTPPAPPIPIPVEPYPGPFPEPVVEPVPEHFPPVPPLSPPVTPGEPLPWPPISTPPPPPTPLLPRKKGPLPGPSPHESCRPYPPNQPFQHPWDDCQVCECSESKGIGMVNVEITCYTKMSCCIESPEHAISAIAGKTNSDNSKTHCVQDSRKVCKCVITDAFTSLVSESSFTLRSASSGPHDEDGHTSDFLNEPITSTIKPPSPYGIYSPGAYQNQGYSEANTVPPSSNNAGYQLPGSFQSTNAISSGISGSQTSAEVNSEYKPQTSFNPYNSGIQSSLSNPYHIPGSYQSANAFGSGPSSAESSAEYLPVSSSNNSPASYSPYNSAISQTQAYTESNAVALKASMTPSYQLSGQYQPGKPISSLNNGPTSAEASEEYVPLSNNYKPQSYSQYNPAVSQSQTYADANAQFNRPLSSTYKPPALYSQYSPEVSSNQAYAEAIAQYNDLMANTQKPPALYGQYKPSISQNQALAQANAQYNGAVTSTYKPPALYAQHKPEMYQNQAYAQANAQYSGIITSTQRPTTFYGQYTPGVPQNQIFPTANSVFKASLTPTEKPLSPFSQYSPPAQAYAGANAKAQASLTSPYYLPSPYESAKALSSVSGSEQSSAVAEAMAQSQDYSPYLQSGPQIGANTISNPTSGYPYQSNYYAGYRNPQFSAYSGRPDQGLDAYKQSPIKYAGNYGFNGQADSISILTPQSSYYPYSSGYSQGIPGSYSSLYPKQSSYEISPMYRPGQYGGSNIQSSAQAFAVTKMQTKSGEGYPEDSDD